MRCSKPYLYAQQKSHRNKPFRRNGRRDASRLNSEYPNPDVTCSLFLKDTEEGSSPVKALSTDSSILLFLPRMEAKEPWWQD